MNQRFGRQLRLQSRGQFTEVQEHGRRVSSRYMVLLARPNALSQDRLGIIASRKFGGAVARNRAKRRLRELFRRTSPCAAADRGERSLDLVAIPRRELLKATLPEVDVDFRSALRRLRGAQ